MITRSALIWLSRRQGVKDFATHLPYFKKFTTRFVAGDTIDDVIPVIRELNNENCTASFDHLNESVSNIAEANTEVAEYLNILGKIDEKQIRSNVSIKLTQFGLGIDPELAYHNARSVVEEAHRRGNFVRIDMEDSSVTQATIDLFKRLRAEFGLDDVGIVLQSYLYRTFADAQELVKLPARIRICKGAYNEPPEVAFPEKKDVDANYIRCMEQLLERGIYPGIATHDVRIIAHAKAFARRRGIAPARFEFQMLYGVRRDLQHALRREGWNVRVYVPFGEQWYPYLMRRLAERPANIAFLLGNVVKESVRAS